jgi:hypothetical protein
MQRGGVANRATAIPSSHTNEDDDILMSWCLNRKMVFKIQGRGQQTPPRPSLQYRVPVSFPVWKGGGGSVPCCDCEGRAMQCVCQTEGH